MHILNLRQMRHMVVLARRLNYVRAAEELGITQPTLTRSIQALERQLELRLFDRDRGGVALTPQGSLIAERANFLLADADELEQHSRLYGQAESGRIRFGMAPMPARALLRHVLEHRLKVSTGTEVSAKVGFQNSLVWRDGLLSVISRYADHAGPLWGDARAVSAEAAG